MITIDFETQSEADLPKVGAWAYSEHPSTDAVCVCWGVDAGPIESWWPGQTFENEMPVNLVTAIEAGHEIEAHNVSFERAIWMNVLTPKYGWVIPGDDRWRDTMAIAQYYALPAALAKLSEVLDLGSKDAEGGRLITKYSKLNLKTAQKEIPDHEWVPWGKMTPTERKANPGSKENGGYFNEDFKKFVDYCIQDVDLERAVSKKLGPLPDQELAVFQFDQAVNLRGLNLDLPGIAVAKQIVTDRASELGAEFREITGFDAGQTAKVKAWFAAQGVALENLQADYLAEFAATKGIEDEKAKRALEIRLAINKASTKKLDAMQRQAGADGRARFQMRYHGAVTGRWTGNGFQPLNLVRNNEGADPDRVVSDIMHGDAALLDILYGDAMSAVSKASRHWIMAPEGHTFLAGDFVSIEAIILSCLAGEIWKVDAFREGVKIYEYMADKIYGLPPGTVTKKTHPAERQDGKTGELAFGYQGALGAWLKFDSSGRHTDERILEICKAWRAEHPAIVRFWAGLQAAALRALADQTRVGYLSIEFEPVDDWLSMILPNGKRVWYWRPRVELRPNRWCDPKENERCATGQCGHEPQAVIEYMAHKEGRWQRVSTYGGKLAENACQAVSREILVQAMLRAEAAGYNVIMSVYDEIVVEVPNDFGSLEEFESIMAGPLPDWAKTWPISVDAWQGTRYKK